jgi:hypothetical protein
VAHAIHHIIRVSDPRVLLTTPLSQLNPLPKDDVLVFFAPIAIFVLESPAFGLTLLITLCLTELLNGIVKLYCVRPRPLSVSTALRYRGSAWEKVRS